MVDPIGLARLFVAVDVRQDFAAGVNAVGEQQVQVVTKPASGDQAAVV